jgi:glycerol-3-phosphate dehydrogenase
VLRIYAGYLPGRRPGRIDLAIRPVIVDHAATGGPKGLWSVSGVKFTTARRVADATLRRAFPDRTRREPPLECVSEASLRRARRTRFGPSWRPDADPTWQDDLRLLIAEESVHHLDDLIWRRTTLGDDPRSARSFAEQLCDVFPWESERRTLELERLEHCLSNATATRESDRRPAPSPR